MVSRIHRIVSLAGTAALVCCATAFAVVERWGVWESELKGPAEGSPYTEVTLAATFTQGGRSLDVPGFWDGGGSYRLRFSPPTEGEWSYLTRSNRPELDGRRGTLTAAAPGGNNRGPVEVFDTFYLRYADGTPYHQYGTTCYVWTHQTPALQEQTLKTLAASPFNKIRFCVFPKAYTYNKNEPPNFAFVKRADGKGFDFDRPDPAFWHHLESRILDLQRLGIEADLILWHPYDRWGFSEMDKAQDDRYLRYCIARLSAFRNLWWSLANEYDLMAPGAMKGHRGNKAMADWDRFFNILANEDPHQRLRSIHNCRGFYDYTHPWVTHASIQTSDMHRGVEFRRQFNKPVLYDECKYEGNVPQGWGNLTAQEMTQRFWLGTLSGCYVGHGETYLHPEDILWWSKGGTLHGGSPARIQWLKAFLADAPPFRELVPLGDAKGRYLLAKPGACYLLYATDTRPQPLELAGDRPYKVDLIDPWAMTVLPLGTQAPGAVTFTPPRAAAAYRFVPYAPGERPRPEATFTATPAAGRAPLDIRFAAPAGLKPRWDFGDGAVSEEPSPVHRFARSGLFTVTLSVTDADGGSASTVREVLIDRDPALPLLRLGVPGGESHALKLSGSARRSDADGFLFTDAAPWGWAEAPPPDELRGLRAFTLSGWLKPASLTVGQGGNRIFFCLNHNRDGIDLVCHADGRLRLAVNQWPDGVSNDSSPGRLVPGKWTRFAVSYDGTRDRDNVRWSFSAPLDAPDATASLVPDRVTSHAAGPVGADIGPLAVGNFNATLRGAGLDRQFRGEIRGLILFGSRTDNAGALTLESISAFQDPVNPAAPRAERPAPRPKKLPELRVSENRRFLVQADGQPFFYLGDTAWELFHRLNREEADRYLANRARHGFTVIQAVAVAELDGLRTPNAYGHLPFHDFDSSRPNEDYFAHVDYIVDRAAELGLYIGMLPSWGGYVGGADAGRPDADFFNALNAAEYGRFLARRYDNKPIIWVLGGDRLADNTAAVWTAMAQGIREIAGQRQLITFHPRGGRSSSQWFHQTDWLDFNMLQSGHSAQSVNYAPVERDYALQPPKPTFDGEPAYEYPPDALPPKRPVGALQVRRNAYWAVFAGAFGHTYGTHPIWQMYDTGRKPLWDVVTPWHQALDLPGAEQLIHLKRLMLSRPFVTRIPDQSVIVPPVPDGVARIQATRDGRPGQDDATYLMAYFPEHRRVTVNTGRIAAAKLRGIWYNPRTGETTSLGEFVNAKTQEFEPPTRATGEDWVLVLEQSTDKRENT